MNGASPMFTAFQDRIEITSIGTMPADQTKEGFYAGVSVPVDVKLTEIFLQLHINEKSGRGVPRIIEAYGKEAFKFSDNAITVTIPFNRINVDAESEEIPPVEDAIPSVDGEIPPVGDANPPVIPPEEGKNVEQKIIEFCSEPRGILEIADMLGYKDKKTVHKYLDPLLTQGRIARTILDKPNSKNQKYITIK